MSPHGCGRQQGRCTLASADWLRAALLPTGFFAYTCGGLVVVEDLHSGAQQHWLGHPEEISTLALSHNAQVLASPPTLPTRVRAWILDNHSGLSPPGQLKGCWSTLPSSQKQDGPWAMPSLLMSCPPALQVLASASGCSGTSSHCHIRIWNVPGGSCQHLISYHSTAVQALAFSPDDELLVTLGQWGWGGQWPLDFPACPGTPGS